MFDIHEETLITSLALGEVLSITDERVRQLEDKGILTSTMKGRKKYFDLIPSVGAYIEFIKGTTAPDLAIAMAQADLRYKEARAGKMELELSELKGQMHRAEDVETVVSDMVANLRAAVLALPGRLAVDTADAKSAKETSAIIKAAVDEVLNETARYRYDAAEYRKLVTEREKWISVKEAESAKKLEEEEKAAPRQKKSRKGNEQKKTVSKRQPASSKGSARASKPRKT